MFKGGPDRSRAAPRMDTMVVLRTSAKLDPAERTMSILNMGLHRPVSPSSPHSPSGPADSSIPGLSRVLISPKGLAPLADHPVASPPSDTEQLDNLAELPPPTDASPKPAATVLGNPHHPLEQPDDDPLRPLRQQLASLLAAANDIQAEIDAATSRPTVTPCPPRGKQPGEHAALPPPAAPKQSAPPAPATSANPPPTQSSSHTQLPGKARKASRKMKKKKPAQSPTTPAEPPSATPLTSPPSSGHRHPPKRRNQAQRVRGRRIPTQSKFPHVMYVPMCVFAALEEFFSTQC